MITDNKIIDEIKNKKWGNDLIRSGFFQSKYIATGAIMLPFELTKGVVAKMNGYIWVNNFIAYSKNSLDFLPLCFEEAFDVESKWPVSILKEIDILASKQKSLLKKMSREIKGISSAKNLFDDYVNLLQEIMKYYVIAVPLTDYCEDELKKINFEYSNFAVTFKKLDIDKYNKSLRQIIKSSGKERERLINKNLKDFAWIKTAYNITEAYSISDLSEAIKNVPVELKRKSIPKTAPHVLIGLQCGIFMRNRMKELCQQLWFYFDPVAKYLANELSLSREEFLFLTPEEVSDSIINKKCKLSKSQIKDRQDGFVCGFINNKRILLTGDDVKELSNYFTPDVQKNVEEFKGSIACKGKVKGKIKIIKTKDKFNQFNEGEILVTSMTTPDFVLIMKKSLAIITDEGGLSCHAAIMSRELNIPCIIGTKIATKVLKDGDLVGVDAEKGIVKILKRNKE
jgi:phosphohistidine swiveling domain-containing protein